VNSRDTLLLFRALLALVFRLGPSPRSAVLGAAAPRPYELPLVARELQSGTGAEAMLRKAIADDLAAVAPHADAYERRMHTATVLRAVQELRTQ